MSTDSGNAPTLVVGATGQLGTAVVRLLQHRGQRVRAFARPTSNYSHLVAHDVELVFGDLRDPEAVQAACQGAGSVIATATVIFPRGSYDFRADEEIGYGNLVEACRSSGVRRIVFMSNAARTFRRIPTLYFKRRVERRIAESGLPYTIFRGAPFMDDYFALIGSSIPLRGTEAPTLRRGFWFSKQFVSSTAQLIDRYGVAIVPGSPELRHAFIALDDVAQYLVNALSISTAIGRTIEIAGPEILSWQQVADLYARLLSRPVRVFPSPALGSALGALALRPLSAAAANQMALLWLMGTHPTLIDGGPAAREFGVEPTSAEDFLRSKLALPA